MHDPDAGHPTKPPKSGCRRAVGCFGWIVAFVLAVLFVPPQISRLQSGDLRPRPQAQVADEANAWVQLLAVVEQLEGGTPKEYLKDAEGGQVNQATRDWIALDAKRLTAFDRAIALPDVVCPWPTMILDDDSRAFGSFREGIRFGCAAALVAGEDGRIADAVTRLRGMLHVAHGMMTCGAPLIATINGNAAESMTLSGITLIATAHPLLPDAEAWAALGKDLLAGPTTGEIVASGRRGEYHYAYTTILAPTELPPDTNDQLKEFLGQQRWVPSSAIFDRWRTMAQYRKVTDLIIAEAAKPRPERDLVPLESPFEVHGLPVYNAYGNSMLTDYSPDAEPTLDLADRSVARRRLTAIFLAARLYYDQHRTLPAKLDDLVAAGLLDAVPLDPFDEQPLRYDPARKLLWSIGWDEQDDGGVEWPASGPRRPLDIVLPIKFVK